MTTGRINQVSHSLPGPGSIARPPRGVHFSETGQCPARNCPASPSTATRSPPCSIIGNGQSRPPINGLPLLPSRSPATSASRNPPASRSTHAQHTHTQLPDHLPLCWMVHAPAAVPRSTTSIAVNQPAPAWRSIPGPWPRRLCHAKPHRSNRSPSPLSRDLPSRELPALHPVLWSCQRNRQPPPRPILFHHAVSPSPSRISRESTSSPCESTAPCSSSTAACRRPSHSPSCSFYVRCVC